MRGIAGFTQLYSQPADVAELIRRMTVSADAAGLTAKDLRFRPGRDACLANPVSAGVSFNLANIMPQW